MNKQIETPLIDDKEARQLKPWHKPHVNVYEMADAESGNAGGDDSDGTSS